MTDQSRRDVLASLAAIGVAPAVPVSDLDREEPTGDVPAVDVGDGHPFWVAMSSAVLHDDPDDAADVLGAVWAIRSAHAGPSVEEVEEHARAAASGEYDRDEIERRAERMSERGFG